MLEKCCIVVRIYEIALQQYDPWLQCRTNKDQNSYHGKAAQTFRRLSLARLQKERGDLNLHFQSRHARLTTTMRRRRRRTQEGPFSSSSPRISLCCLSLLCYAYSALPWALREMERASMASLLKHRTVKAY